MSTEPTSRALITVVTPAYNRADLLGRLRESLLAQSDQDFVWLVVDDGSTDGTAELLAGWQQEPAPYGFEVIIQQNGGKHRAVNAAVAQVQTPYLMVVDSDDWLLPEGLRTVRGWLEGLDDPQLAGVAGLRLYPDGSPIGGLPRIPAGQAYLECNNLERARHGLMGDKAEIYRTEILRRYPYPEYVGERFIEEAIVGDAMAAYGLRLRWYAQGIYYGEYQQGGLSANIDRHHLASFEGYTAYAAQYVRLHGRREALAMAGVYADIASQRGLTVRQAAQRIDLSPVTLLATRTARRAVSGLRRLRSR